MNRTTSMIGFMDGTRSAALESGPGFIEALEPSRAGSHLRAPRRARSIGLVLVLTSLSACTELKPAVNLRPGLVKVYERQLKFGNQQESIKVVDMARDGNTVVLLIAFGYKTFFDHPGVGGTPAMGSTPGMSGGPSTGSSGNSGYYLLAVSTDDAATFTVVPLNAKDGVGGEAMGVHLHGGNAWMVLRTPGPGTTVSPFVHPLDLATATVQEAIPGQRFFGFGESTLLVSGATVTQSVAATGDVDRQDGSFGIQQLDLSTGLFTDRVKTVRFDSCYAQLHSADNGATWLGYRPCGEMQCQYTMTFANSGEVTRDCVARALWPAPFTPEGSEGVGVFETPAGVVVGYTNDGNAYVARIENGTVVKTLLGPGKVDNAYQSGRRVHLPFGNLIDIGGKLVRLSATGAAVEIPVVRSACVAGAPCGELTRIVPMTGDDYLASYYADIGRDQIVGAIFVHKETAPPMPLVTGQQANSPIPGCPWALPASPLVTACARAVSCFPTVDVRNCIRDWSTTGRGPTSAALAKFIATTDCNGFMTSYPAIAVPRHPNCVVGCALDTAVRRCAGSGQVPFAIDCAARGMTCRNTPGKGPGCYDDTPGTCGTCDSLGRLVECDGTTPITTNCAAFGQTCSAALGAATCVDARCPALGSASVCAEGRRVSCNGVDDCGLQGMECSVHGSRAQCVRANAPECIGTMNGCSSFCAGQGCATAWGCPTQGCAGTNMLIDLGDERTWVDCTAIGYRTCQVSTAQVPGCVQ
ncbi:MAG: hypothetical protein Q8L14_40060 [Myxococcales bacterium]|nr:hypothetical protein [Myxococcales bacterium]